MEKWWARDERMALGLSPWPGPQRSNAARVRNTTDLLQANYREIIKTCFKKSEDKAVYWKEKLQTLSICGKRPICLPLTLSPRTLFRH